MNITLGQLNAALPALQKILNSNSPISFSYPLHKLVAAVDNELKIYETERKKLVMKYGTVDEKGDTKVDPANTEFWDELTKVLEMVVEIATDGIDIAKIIDSDLKISAVELASIEMFFKA